MFLRLSPVMFDRLIAAKLMALMVLVTFVFLEPGPGQLTIGLSLSLVACGALLWRRRFPVTVAVVTLLCSAAYYPALDADGPLVITYGIALFTVAYQGRVVPALVLAIGSAAALAITEANSDENHLADGALFLLGGWLFAVVAAGGLLRNRNAYLAEARRRLEEAERIVEEESRRRAAEERLRIARELHDVVGHHLSLINVQAGAALHGFARDPAGAEEALSAIRSTSREALRELRRTVGVLRQVDEDAPTLPAPGIARLDDLIAHTRRTGLDVRLELPRRTTELPPAVDLAVYRIAQEALTNVTRHAGAATARVAVALEDGKVSVEIEDDGKGGDVEAGNGMRGMRERARALGGTLDAGALPHGGFRVRATIPVGGA